MWNRQASRQGTVGQGPEEPVKEPVKELVIEPVEEPVKEPVEEVQQHIQCKLMEYEQPRTLSVSE